MYIIYVHILTTFGHESRCIFAYLLEKCSFPILRTAHHVIVNSNFTLSNLSTIFLSHGDLGNRSDSFKVKKSVGGAEDFV
jgi:hypothetical protein